MRIILLALPLFLASSPAIAEPPQVEPFQVPPELTDPALAERLANTTEALSRMFLNMPVGGIQAALEGRVASPAEERLTVRDVGRRDNPDFDRDFARQIADSRPMMRQGMQAMARALPAMSAAMSQFAAEMERAMGDVPRPERPRR